MYQNGKKKKDVIHWASRNSGEDTQHGRAVHTEKWQDGMWGVEVKHGEVVTPSMFEEKGQQGLEVGSCWLSSLICEFSNTQES